MHDIPKPGEILTIKMFGKAAGLLDKPVNKVTVLCSRDKLKWEYNEEGLTIYCPEKMRFNYGVCFKIQ